MENIRLQYVAADTKDADSLVAQSAIEIGRSPANKIVVYQDLADVGFQKLVDRVRTDQPGAPNHHHLLVVEVHIANLSRADGWPSAAPRL